MDSPLHLGLGSSSGAALYPVAVEVPLIGSEEQRDFIFPSFPSRDDGQSTSPSGPERAAAAVRGALCARSHMSDGATLKDEEEVKPPTNITFTNILTLDLHAGPRRAIRETRVDVGVFADIRILRVFLLGRSADSVLNKMVEQESRVFHDIVVGNFIDSYHNLTLKTMMGIRWVATFCPPAQYIMKTDSDVFVNMHNLIYELLKPTAEPRRRYYVGRVLICSISGHVGYY
ncbi:UDP-Gal:betaGlcNAc beta 1-3-galactosyltransferase 1-like [Scophthalmus maximus]|uniref:Hexosyltransferase n=1 Tax=Scophthalmus maximus TaxID=52904 RepID=A0A2U9C5A6_SCOMX|nr:UDP-Gal:betaGlcNAc beta 1-3-galactosyltransferase 1-like [Scophthalmus maximus]